MQLIIRVLLAVIITLCGFNILQHLNTYSYGLFDFFNKLPVISISIAGIFAFYIDSKNYKITRKLHQFITSFICFVVCIIYAVTCYSNYTVDKAVPILTLVNKAGDDRVFMFEFKKYGHLKITWYDMLGHDVYYCRYQQHGDTLIITKIPNGAETGRLPTTGIIRRDSVFWNNNDTMLVYTQNH